MNYLQKFLWQIVKLFNSNFVPHVSFCEVVFSNYSSELMQPKNVLEVLVLWNEISLNDELLWEFSPNR